MGIRDVVASHTIVGMDPPEEPTKETPEESGEEAPAEQAEETAAEGTEKEGDKAESDEAAEADDEAGEDGSGDDVAEGEAEGEVEASAEEEYTPNLTFKVYDEERQMDEWAQPLITKDNEENFRKLFAAAGATEKMREKLDTSQTRVQELEGAVQGWETDVRDTLSLADEGDFDAFFQELKIPITKVAEWLLEKIELEKLSPAQRAVYDERSRLRQERRELDRQNRTLGTRASAAEFQTRTRELKEAVSRPEVMALAQDYDKSQGQLGAFLDFVIKNARAEFHASQGKTDFTADQAVESALKVLGLKAGKSPTTATQAKKPTEAKTKQKVITAPKTAVIPNVGASNAAPTDFKPKSLDDIRRYAAKQARAR